MKKPNQPHLHVVLGGPGVESFSDWRRRGQTPGWFETVFRAHMMLDANHLGYLGVNVIGEFCHQPIFEVGASSTARLALATADGRSWLVGVKPSRKIILKTSNLNFHALVAAQKEGGLPEAWCFPCYDEADDKHRFSLHVYSPFDLMIIVWQIAGHFH